MTVPTQNVGVTGDLGPNCDFNSFPMTTGKQALFLGKYPLPGRLSAFAFFFFFFNLFGLIIETQQIPFLMPPQNWDAAPAW